MQGDAIPRGGSPFCSPAAAASAPAASVQRRPTRPPSPPAMTHDSPAFPRGTVASRQAAPSDRFAPLGPGIRYARPSISATRPTGSRHKLAQGLLIGVGLGLVAPQVTAQQQQPASTPSRSETSSANAGQTVLPTVTVKASADASAEGLTAPYAGGQVARGGRVGLFGNRDVMETPFSTTSYTQEMIQDQQVRSVGDLLRVDPSVRVARGFGNFQESFFIRGFLLGSDAIAYNGLYSLLPRQYISAELFERVELLRGASAFLNGASPDGDAIGGSINLLPKRAPNEPLSRVTVGLSSGLQSYLAADVARRFGPDQNTGIRINVARRDGDTAIDREGVELSVAAIGIDWRNSRARVSADIGYQNHKLSETRTNVTLGSTVTVVPRAPSNETNWAQRWTWSNERDTFGTLRAEYDINDDLTVYGAWGMRRSKEANSLAGLTVTDGSTGAGTMTRFDNTREDKVDTGEVGVRTKLSTGPVRHALVAGYSRFDLDVANAYGMQTGSSMATNLYAPVFHDRPDNTLFGNDLANPRKQRTTKLTSYAIGDTMSLLEESVQLTLGLRRQKLDYDNYAYNTGAPGTGYEDSHTSPLVALLYRLREDLSVYANYAEALSQGGVAPSTAVNFGAALAPYVSKQKEIGIKYDSGRLGAGLALFTTNRPRAFVDAQGIFGEAGEDRHRGIELTVFGEPLGGLRVLGGLTFLNAEQRSTGSAATDGRKVIGVPTAQGSLGLEWDVPGLRGLALDTRLIASRGVYANGTNTLRVPGWASLDIGGRYLTEIAGKVVTFRARLNNVANRDYWASAGGYPGSGYLVLSTPRTFVLSASVDL